MNRADSLVQLARLNGLQTSYLQMGRRCKVASRETLVATLNALGVAASNESDIRDSLREARLLGFRQHLEPVTVAWKGTPTKVQLHLPAQLAEARIRMRLHAEDSEEINAPSPEFKTIARVLRKTELGGECFVTKEITLPDLPPGYHTLHVEVGRMTCQTLVISAPLHSYSDPHARKVWGAFLPLYAAHSQRSWGAGNFSDFEQLAGWIGSSGGSILGTLPLHATFLDFPVCEPSPYSPASRLFWNEFYIDIERVPEFKTCAEAQRLADSAKVQNQLRAFQHDEQIDYRAQWTVRRQILEVLAKSFFSGNSARRAKLNAFLRERPEVKDYAAFRAVCDRLKSSWHNWPDRLLRGELRRVDYDSSTRDFHLYAQWLAHEQIDQLAATCDRHGVDVYLDLPLGVNSDGYDVWRERETFAMDARVGAPPDLFFTKGQDWGFAPFHPRRLRESGYRHLREILRFQMRHARILRIDHIMGLHRLYWIPKGGSAADGVYVRYPADEFHAIFNLESHRYRTKLIGENLGTVPPEVNCSMKRHRIRQMFVVQYEWRPDPKDALRQPPALAVASLNTHDMPPFAALWRETDLADRAALGLIPHGKLPAERQNREKLKRALLHFLVAQGCLKKRNANLHAVLDALLSWLGATKAEIVLVNLEDLWLETRPQNTPGTSSERPNWRHKARLTLDDMQKDRGAIRALRQIQR